MAVPAAPARRLPRWATPTVCVIASVVMLSCLCGGIPAVTWSLVRNATTDSSTGIVERDGRVTVTGRVESCGIVADDALFATLEHMADDGPKKLQPTRDAIFVKTRNGTEFNCVSEPGAHVVLLFGLEPGVYVSITGVPGGQIGDIRFLSDCRVIKVSRAPF
jgi:hypothetical protein